MGTMCWGTTCKIPAGSKPEKLLYTQEEGYAGKSIDELARMYGPRFASNVDEVVEHSDIVFVAVQTPHDPKFSITRLSSIKERADFDYSYLQDAMRNIDKAVLANGSNKHVSVIVISTVFPEPYVVTSCDH